MILWVAMAWGGPEGAIQRLLDDGKVEDAQKRCERAGAVASDADGALRSVCAEAMWPLAVAEGTYAGWVKFQTDWAGTSKAKAAREMEAEVRLKGLGEKASEADYAGWLETYGTTGSAPRARELQALAAIATVQNADDAKRVALAYPGSPAIPELVRPWFDAFVQLSIDGESVQARLEPDVRFPGAVLEARWAARAKGKVTPWDGFAVAHLEAQGTPRPLIDRLARKGDGLRYPPCPVPDAELGVHVTYGEAWDFVVQQRPCAGDHPGFVSVREGSIVGLTVHPGHTNVFAGPSDKTFPFEQRSTRTDMVVLGKGLPGITQVGLVLGQKVQTGRANTEIWMLQSISGGLPWYVAEGPPATSIVLPDHPVGVAFPDDVAVFDAPQGGKRLERRGDPGFHRWLPDGEVRRVSPLLLEILDLHGGNVAFARFELSSVPAGLKGDALSTVTNTQLLEVQQALAPFDVTAAEAWRLSLSADRGIEVAFRGSFQGRPVRGLVDPNASGGVRLHVWADEAPAGTTALAARHEGRVVLVWAGSKGGSAYQETLHVDGRGLVRTVLPRR